MARHSRKERERTFMQLGAIGIGYDVASKLLRYGTTLQRLAEASCNGDWPADNGTGDTAVCTRCQGHWRGGMVQAKGKCAACAGKGSTPVGVRIGPDALTGTPIDAHVWELCGHCESTGRKLICADCRTEELARTLAEAHGLTPKFNGDPRGGIFSVTKDGQEVYIA